MSYQHDHVKNRQSTMKEKEKLGHAINLIIYVNERKITQFCDYMEKSKLRIKSIEENHREGRKTIFSKAAQENVQPLGAAHAGPREHQYKNQENKFSPIYYSLRN